MTSTLIDAEAGKFKSRHSLSRVALAVQNTWLKKGLSVKAPVSLVDKVILVTRQSRRFGHTGVLDTANHRKVLKLRQYCAGTIGCRTLNCSVENPMTSRASQ